MKTVLKLVMLVAVMVGASYAQTATVTGQINDPTTAAANKNTTVEFVIKGCGGNPPRVNGSYLLTGDSNGSEIAVTFPLNSSGQIVSRTGGAATIVRNDSITCGTSTDTNSWVMTVIRNGARGAPCSVRITAATFDATQPACLNAVSAAALDPDVLTALTFLKVDASNGPVSGHLRAKKLEDVRYVDQFSAATLALQVAAACADLGGNPGTVVIPSSMTTGDYRSGQTDNCTVEDQRTTGGFNENGTYNAGFIKSPFRSSRWTSTPLQNISYQSTYHYAEQVSGGLDLSVYNLATNANGTYKANYLAHRFEFISRSPGQKHVLTFDGACASKGDCAGLAGSLVVSGGVDLSVGNEGAQHVLSIAQGQAFTGTVSAVAGNVVSYTSSSNSGCCSGENRFVTLTSSGTYSTGTASVSGTTVTGIGTTWTALGTINNGASATGNNYCFSLDAETRDGSTRLFIPIESRASDTSLTLRFNYNNMFEVTPGVAGAYVIRKCSESVAVSVLTASAGSITLRDASMFTAASTFSMEISSQLLASSLVVAATPRIPNYGFYGIGMQNRGYVKMYSAYGSSGNFTRLLAMSAWTAQPSYFTQLQDTGGVGLPSTWFAMSTTATGKLYLPFDLGNADKGTASRWWWNPATDNWYAQGSGSSSVSFGVNFSDMNAGVGTNPVAGQQFTVTTTGTNHAVVINGNATGDLIQAKQSGTKFSVGPTGNTVVAGSLTIGGGTAILKHLSATASLDYDLSGAGITEQDLTITVTGAAAGDVVALGLPTALQAAGINCFGFVSSSNTVTVRCQDVTSSNPNPAAATVRADVWQN